MVDISQDLSRDAFECAGLEGVMPLLIQLQSIIQDATDGITESDKESSEKSNALNVLWEGCCEELNKLGHRMYRHDYGGDVRWERNSQVWGQDYMNAQNGLEIEFYPRRITVSWVIRPAPPTNTDASDA